MSILEKLYNSQPSNLEKEVENFVLQKKDIPEEIQALKKLLQNSNFEKGLFVFYSDILTKTINNPSDLNSLITILLEFIDNNLNLKNSILILRIIKNLTLKNYFIPLSFYLTKLFNFAINIKVRKGDKKYTYDHIRLSNDDLDSEDLQMFIIKECIILIKKQCFTFSNNIGFPEYASVVINELSSCKVGIFKELISDLIKRISDRKNYIEEERTKLKIDVLNGNKVLEFENSLIKWDI